LNGIYVPEIRVKRETPDGEIQLVVLDADLGWFVVDGNEGIHTALPQFKLEYRDETAWALLTPEMMQDSVDKGWNRTTPKELIGILWSIGVLK